MKPIFLILCLAGLSGCFQAYDPDDDLRTVPVTNNPTLVPNAGGGLPMGALNDFSLDTRG